MSLKVGDRVRYTEYFLDFLGQNGHADLVPAWRERVGTILSVHYHRSEISESRVLAMVEFDNGPTESVNVGNLRLGMELAV